ncbi:unnamed protein product [Symbiodinium sp. CCMP2592]|nr:unnamed protein product [Symbiodinium sp. CCMP2592]
MLSYDHLERETAAFRKRCAQASYARIQAAIKRTSRLSLRCRVRLWRAVVWTTLCYGIDCTGLDIVGRRQLYATAVRHLRAIANSPSHISKETTSDLLLRLELPHPMAMLLDKTKARHDRTCQSQVFTLQPPGLTQVWDSVLVSLEVPGRQTPATTHSAAVVEPPAALNNTMQAAEGSPEPEAEICMKNLTAAPISTPAEAMITVETPPPAPTETGAHVDLVCPVCEYQAADTTALRYHMTSIHGLSERELAMATAAPFKFEEHSYAGMPTCKHCRKSFSGIPQFRKHIEAQACPVLHGYTNNSRDYGQLPPLPKEASTESTPLRDRPSTLQNLSEGGWLQLAQSPGFREVALAHCPLCHLWVANSSGQVKKHMRTKHGDQQDLIQEVIEVCRKSSYFIQSPCQLCGIAWKGARIRHREACAVLFAARLLAAHHGYVFRDEHGSRAITSDGVRVGVQPTAAEPIPVLPPPAADPSNAAKAKRGPAQPNYQGYQGYQGYSEMYVTPQEIQLLRQLLVRHEWELAALRVDRGFVLHMRSGPDGILREVFQASRLWNEAKTQGTLQNLTLRQALLMKVFTVLKDRMEHLNEGHIATARKHGWLSRDSMQWQYLKWSQTQECLIPEDPIRQVPHASLVQHITSILQALNMDHMIHRFAATRKLTENVENTMPFLLQISLQGQTAHQLFQALQDLCGAGCLQLIGMTMRRERLDLTGQGVGGSSSSADSGGRYTQFEADATRSKIRAWKLLNQGRNSCYANTLLSSLVWSETFLGCQLFEGPLGSSLRSLVQAGRTVDIWSVLPWINATRSWRAPRQQHDIAEFLLYMRPQLNASLIDGSWGAAGPASAADDPTPCSECCLQDLLSCWHQQAEPQALLKPPKFCAIQVGRFDSTNDGACIKTDFKLCLEPLVHIPAFRDNLQDVYFVKYFVRACAVHHGPTPDSGHYRSILMPPNGVLAQSFYTDDNATARKVKSSIFIFGVRGEANVADLFTKPLSWTVTLKHMWGLGLRDIAVVACVLDGFVALCGAMLVGKNHVSLRDRFAAMPHASWLVIEFCAPVESSMRAASQDLNWVNVLTVSERDDGASNQTLLELKAIFAVQIKKKGFVFLWASTPCTGGCPYQRLRARDPAYRRGRTFKMSLVPFAAERAMVFGLAVEVQEKLLEVPSVGLLVVVLVPLLVGVALGVCLQKLRTESSRVKTVQDLLSFLPRSGQKMAVFTSAYGDCFHVRRDCHGLRNALPNRIAAKVACEYCLRDLHLVPPTATASWGGVENQCSAQ